MTKRKKGRNSRRSSSSGSSSSGSSTSSRPRTLTDRSPCYQIPHASYGLDACDGSARLLAGVGDCTVSSIVGVEAEATWSELPGRPGGV